MPGANPGQIFNKVKYVNLEFAYLKDLSTVGWCGPSSVLPEYQSNGIGVELLRYGFRFLTLEGAMLSKIKFEKSIKVIIKSVFLMGYL